MIFNRKIKIIDAVVFLLFFSIIKISIVPQFVQQIIKIISLLAVTLYVGRSWKNMEAGHVLPIVWLVSSLYSFLCGNIEFKTLLDGLLNAVCILDICLLVKIFRRRGTLKELMYTLWNFGLLAVLCSLTSIIFSSGDKVGAFDIYFFGNKYATCYIFLFFTALSFYRFYDCKSQKLKRPIVYVLIIILSILVSVYVKCSTTLVGSIVMGLSLLRPGKRSNALQEKIEKPFMAIIYTVAPAFLAMNAAVFISNNTFIRTIITEYLGKSAGMTGRVYIYSVFADIAKNHPILGYGYNNGIVERITEVGNPQNGLMELLINYGIVGVVFFVIVCYLAFKHSEGIKELWGLKIFVISMCVCSIVEISYNYIFLLAIYILYSYKLPNYITAGKELC